MNNNNNKKRVTLCPLYTCFFLTARKTLHEPKPVESRTLFELVSIASSIDSVFLQQNCVVYQRLKSSGCSHEGDKHRERHDEVANHDWIFLVAFQSACTIREYG